MASNVTRTKTGIYGSPVQYSVSPLVFSHIWEALGIAGDGYNYGQYECPTTDDPNCVWRANMRKPDHIGSSITMPIKLAVIPYLDELTPEAKAVGGVNTTKLSIRDGKTYQIGTNLDIKAILNSLRTCLTGVASPFPDTTPSTFGEGKAAGMVIGGGGATRAAIYALHQMKMSPILIFNRDQEETRSIIQQFPYADVREVRDVSEARQALKEIEAAGRVLCLGVGCIPSIQPKSEEERMVYDIAQTIFAHQMPVQKRTSESAPTQTCEFAIPDMPVFFDMAYKPIMTLLRELAEKNGWRTGSGADIVTENCFEQCEWWLGRSVPAEAREKIREIVRKL